MIFDSRSLSCKSPFGAVRAGETVTFTIHLPKMHHNTAPVLKLFEMDQWDDPLVIPMHLAAADYLSNRYSCSFTPEAPRLYAYYFELFSGGALLSLKRGQDGFGELSDEGSLWQLTVYDPCMRAPDALRQGVLYQIFPDRFYRSGTPKENVPADRLLREDWGEIPVWQPDARGLVTNNDYFQGDLRGIEEKLPYLEELGVTAIYLNPIFEAHTNHRYNTADYRKIDPLLGGEEDLRRLCAAAARRGISILLDGVFSHTGSDSVYFNKEGRYGEGGAFRDPESPYRDWYRFTSYPHAYESWWGFETLPNVREEAPSYLDFICGEDGVLRKWLDCGVAGFRLDVADELPDVFLDRLHNCVKGHSPGHAIIGEVWEDASNKMSYGARRRYLLGGQLDSVMNYPFKDAILNYIRWGNAASFYEVIMQILENYPPPAIQSLMNSLSTHDTPRAITELVGPLLEQHDREWQVRNHYLSPAQYEQGRKLLKLASILQFGLPGIPCIYYGDEAGLSGYRDPFNRVCYPWGKEDTELVSFIRTLAGIRRDHPIFAEAAFIPLTFSREICAFTRETEQICLLFAVNRSEHLQRVGVNQPSGEMEVLAVTGDYDGTALGAYSGVVLLIRKPFSGRALPDCPPEPESAIRSFWMHRPRKRR